MSQDNETPHDSSDAEYTNYEPLESAIETAQDILEDIEAAVPEAFRADVDELEDHLEDVEDQVDDAQDTDDATSLGPVPATVDYLQAYAKRLAEQAEEGGDEFADFATAMEGVEDRLEQFDISRTKWFAQVNGVPLLSPNRTVEASWLVDEALDPDDVANYTLEAYTSPVDEEPDKQYPRPDHEVDLADYDIFRTARDKGGGPV